MPCFFPGMDPYLETKVHWTAFQQQMIAALYQLLIPGLADRYKARVANRQYCTEVVLFTSVTKEPQAEPIVEIRDRSNNKLVTLMEIVSPANKTTSEGRSAYLSQRREALRSGANVVEIDLVLDGQPTLDYNRDGLPDWDHAVTVTRGTQPERHEIYTATLQKPLPRFRLPLAADHRDTLIDLQAAFIRAFEQGQFASKIDYSIDPAVPLDDEDREWLRDLLKRNKLRE